MMSSGVPSRLAAVPRIAPLQVQVIARTSFDPPDDVPWETDADGGQALAEFAGRACYESWDKPHPATATHQGLLRHAPEGGHRAHPGVRAPRRRGGPRLGAGAREREPVPHRRLPVAHPRAGPAPPLLVQP